MPKSSAVWSYFSRLDSLNVRCNVCHSSLKAAGSTTTLWSHLQAKHSFLHYQAMPDIEGSTEEEAMASISGPSSSCNRCVKINLFYLSLLVQYVPLHQRFSNFCTPSTTKMKFIGLAYHLKFLTH